MRTKGKITKWNDDKGFGFIAPLDGGKQVFVHVTAFSNRNRRPELNEVVSYSLAKDKQGRTCAANATLAGDKLREKKPRKSSTSSIFFAVLFVVAIGLLALTGYVSIFLLIGYLALSVVTFMAYAFDKSAAKSGTWRTDEGTLLLLGLAGGWPGALIAQETLRHKSKKTSFRIVFWVTVLVNCAALVWLLTDIGNGTIKGLFA